MVLGFSRPYSILRIISRLKRQKNMTLVDRPAVFSTKIDLPIYCWQMNMITANAKFIYLKQFGMYKTHWFRANIENIKKQGNLKYVLKLLCPRVQCKSTATAPSHVPFHSKSNKNERLWLFGPVEKSSSKNFASTATVANWSNNAIDIYTQYGQ